MLGDIKLNQAMNEARAAIRYAKATLDFAAEKKAADKVEKDMRTIAIVISENSELQHVLSSPVVKAVKTSPSERGCKKIRLF